MPPLQTCMFEVEHQTDLQSSYSEVIQHPPNFVVANALDRFSVNDQSLLDHEVRNVLSNDLMSIVYPESWLLSEWDASYIHFDA